MDSNSHDKICSVLEQPFSDGNPVLSLYDHLDYLVSVVGAYPLPFFEAITKPHFPAFQRAYRESSRLHMFVFLQLLFSN